MHLTFCCGYYGVCTELSVGEDIILWKFGKQAAFTDRKEGVGFEMVHNLANYMYVILAAGVLMSSRCLGIVCELLGISTLILFLWG